MQKTDGYRELSRSRALADVIEAELLQPQELLQGRYRPLSVLGSGGYGTVFLAWDEQLTRRVAIKEIALDDSMSATAAESALAEARTAAMLSHPNIVTVHDFILNGDTAYIIMEYIEGVSLASLSDTQLSASEIAHIAKSLSAALSFGHRNGVLHLDIKPSNVIISSSGQVKLIDFGVAKLVGTREGHAAGGTVGYMPLEQMEGRTVSKLSDEWSLAALIYELYYGELPYANKVRFNDYDELIELQREADPELLTSGNDALDSALARALLTEPAHRYPSVKSFTDDLLSGLEAPKEGRKELASYVADLIGDEDLELNADEGAPVEYESDELFWDRLGLFAWRGLLALLVFGLLAHLLFAQGLMTEFYAEIIGVVAVGIIFGFSPVLGIMLASAAASFMLFMSGEWLLASALILLASPWWFFIGRLGNAASLSGLVFLAAFIELNFSSKLFFSTNWPEFFPGFTYLANLALLLSFILLSALIYWIMQKRTIS